ncbi:serine carboxypeptidase-like 25 [Olea europaea subsp. europaea]|uniref:Carboxypeptidase n=1 Tax=Olea europaea subsp. europaea TaxID=158383 RepID=A0A8S0T8X6_OLEEU|nr:serine carboxypeptidase-like 25 [Olea europaea subsp. europaea]
MEKQRVSVSVIAILLLALHVSSNYTEEEEESDRIEALPGQPKVTFQQFSGYVTVNEVAGRALFYWLTEAVQDPLEKPLVVWLNGGRAVFDDNISKLTYLLSISPRSPPKSDSPLFFSPSSIYRQCRHVLLTLFDQICSKDSLQFLIRWMKRFPRYKNRDIYVTGESYAGHYIPQLAREIVNHNAKAKHKINLKGFMVGNAVTDNYYDNLGTVTYWWSHAMISDKTYHQLISTCDFKRQKESNECESLYYYAMDQEFGNIDQYNIYAPPCNNSDGSTGATRQTMNLPHRPHRVFRELSGYDPCTEKYAEIYYNRPDVQKALHANTTGIPYKWTACSETLNRNWNDTDDSILPIYRELIAVGLRIWVFSGDVDSVVPVTATRYSLAQLKLDTSIPWYPWYVKKQVAGWTEVYKGLTFATVRGAGHEVPLFKPRAAFQLLRSFLQGEPLPKKWK